MEISVFKLLLILIIALVFFGGGKIPQLMGDIGKGIKALKEGLKDQPADKQDSAKIPDSHNDKNA